ncbi:MAG: hypothetical protein JXQ68_01530 [Campylobacterales bacterium]|nr:hypothetical protein [Campylobacterales bacterium]
MIAIPLDTKESKAMSKYYGNAPFFALLDEQSGGFEIIENEACGNGLDTAKFLIGKGVSATLFYYMGEGIYREFTKENLKVFSCAKTIYTIDEIYEAFKTDSFTKLDESNFKELLDPGESGSCSCGCEGD